MSATLNNLNDLPKPQFPSWKMGTIKVAILQDFCKD